MSQPQEQLKDIVAHAKEYGYIFPSSEIYDGLGAVYDYGPYGVELKNNIKKYWWKSMVQMHDNIVGLDAAIFMHTKTWEASGHLSAFNDILIDNKDSKKRYRADVLVEDYIAKIEAKIDKEIQKAAKRFGADFDEKQFRATNPRVLKNQEKIDAITQKLQAALEADDLKAFRPLIEELGIACPESGSKNWSEARRFNLMFGTDMGAVADGSQKVYLRPETAQGIFVNYLNIQKTARQKIPFGIAQIGKAFRNEIIARQFIFRMREFEQMEMEFFVRPGTEEKFYEYWKKTRQQWHLDLGIPKDFYRFHDHLKPAHYANFACDIEYKFPFGFKELEGIHSRTDFDLKQHQEHSGKKLQYFDPELKESYVPYVIETSIGLDRMFLAVLSYAFQEEALEKGSRSVLKIPPALAPVKAAILPLVKKDGLPEMAHRIFDDLKGDFYCQYDEKDAIGKRYRRQDAIGTPFCITVDHQSLEDETVTLRNRDDLSQERIAIKELYPKIAAGIRL